MTVSTSTYLDSFSSIVKPFQHAAVWAMRKVDTVKNYLNDCSDSTQSTLKKVGIAAGCGVAVAFPAYSALSSLSQAAFLGASAAAIGVGVSEWVKESPNPDKLALKSVENLTPELREEDPTEPLKEPVIPVKIDVQEPVQESSGPPPLFSPSTTPETRAASVATTVEQSGCCSGLKTSLKKLAFRVVAIFKAAVLIFTSIFLFLAGTAIIWIPPAKHLGYELWMNGVLGLKILKQTILENFIRDPFFDSSNLLKNDEGTFQSEFSWYLNLGLMRDAYEKTDDPKLKDQLQFLAANYLAKAAPYNTEKLRYLNSTFDLLNQIPDISGSAYHRASFRGKIELGEKFNQELAIGNESPLILTDTTELSELFTLGFKTFTSQSEDTIKDALVAHFAKNSEAPFAQSLPMLMDLTTALEACIYDKTKSDQAQEVLSQFRAKIQRITEEISTENPLLSAEQIHQFIEQNLACISRVNIGEIAGIKILPLNPSTTGTDLIESQSTLCDFISATGTYINRLSLYRHVLKDNLFIERNTQYAVTGPEGVQYFKQIEDFTRNLRIFGPDEKTHVQVLGNSTIQLLKGWAAEIGQAKWEEITKNPALREILDGTLYKIKIQLANAELHKNDYNKFNQAIELAHNELAILLELTAPFSRDDFSSIYQEALQIVPQELKSSVQAGVAKTAMNVYTGIELALSKMTAGENRTPVRAYCPNLYYETVSFSGQAHPIEEAINTATISHIDHYSTQFNSNIRVESAHTNYEVTDVAGDIQKLLAARPDTKHLTVSVDCTIDYFNSPRVAALLELFKQEIQDGKLNFVFFRSGQKFEMLGMDNYYGAPYYIVNNGQSPWVSFNQQFSAPAFKTDSLSMQWFCLSNRYASGLIDAYRNQVFKNSREILNRVPASLRPQLDPSQQRVRVNTVEASMDAAFIDIKVSGSFHRIRSKALMASFLNHCIEQDVKTDARGSFGFSHPNITTISVDSDSSTSLRITPGINSEENEVIVDFLNNLVKLNNN